MNQPYQAPNADVAVAGGDATYEPKMFSAAGRIGRMRYFVYGAMLSVIFYAVLLAVVGIVAAVSGGFAEAQQGGGMIVLGLVYFALAAVGLVYGVIFMVRRLNDINTSGWMALLMLVPLVNLVMLLVLLFKRGTEGENNFGPAPVANSSGIKVGFAVLMVLWVLSFVGILAAVAIPAYQGYVQQAQSMQMDYEQGYDY